MRELTVAIDGDSGDECLYIDGECWENTGEITVYAADIDTAAGGEPIAFRHVEVDCPGKWPKTLDKLRDSAGNPIIQGEVSDGE